MQRIIQYEDSDTRERGVEIYFLAMTRLSLWKRRREDLKKLTKSIITLLLITTITNSIKKSQAPYFDTRSSVK